MDSDFLWAFTYPSNPGQDHQSHYLNVYLDFLIIRAMWGIRGALEGPCEMELKDFLFTRLLGTCLKEAFPSLTPYLTYLNLPGLDPKPEKGHEWNNWQSKAVD